ncbi:MAG: sirohydrochlorin chelatase [Pirellulaceae bacterium]
MATGLLVIGHGSRDNAGLAEYEQAVRLVAARLPDVVVQASYLELAEPTIGAGLERLVAAGAARILAVPLLLLAAGHARRDIPAELSDASRRWPGLDIRLAGHLGCHARLLELSQLRLYEGLRMCGESGAAAAGSWRLIVVGRGSSDEQARQELGEYVRALAERMGASGVEIAYVAAAHPRLGEALSKYEGLPGTRLLVLPHLLFQGEVLREIRECVAGFCKRNPASRVCVAPHLGPSPLLVDVIVARWQEAQRGPA